MKRDEEREKITKLPKEKTNRKHRKRRREKRKKSTDKCSLKSGPFSQMFKMRGKSCAPFVTALILRRMMTGQNMSPSLE